MAGFAWQEQLEDHFNDPYPRAWYNSSYTMDAKPIKCLELHYTMIQFLIKGVIFERNCGAASVGSVNECLVLLTRVYTVIWPP